jgi:hypothetical protein
MLQFAKRPPSLSIGAPASPEPEEEPEEDPEEEPDEDPEEEPDDDPDEEPEEEPDEDPEEEPDDDPEPEAPAPPPSSGLTTVAAEPEHAAKAQRAASTGTPHMSPR